MVRAGFAIELERYGPAADAPPVNLIQAQEYCRALAHSHYENFKVASLLLPRELRPHFYAVYAYCRWSDDLSDEVDSSAESLRLLDWWEGELNAVYAGGSGEIVRHPVFVALAETIRKFAIPREPFANLLIAFRQDQRVTRYETFADLLGYCRNSADPVGRIVLYLGRCHDETRGALSDSICTGLQLANFWQDVDNDWDRGRIYLPLEACRRHGYTEAMFGRREYNAAFRDLLREQVDIAEDWLRKGLPLVKTLPRPLARDVRLMAHGGLAILEAIRGVDYDVWNRRPEVGKSTQVKLLAVSWLRTLRLPKQARQPVGGNR